MVFNEGDKATGWGKDSFFNKLCWGNSMPTSKRMNEPFSDTIRKDQPQTDQRPKYKSLIEGNRGKTSGCWIW